MIRDYLRRAASSAFVKLALAAVCLFMAFERAGWGWCGYTQGCPPEFFLTRIDATAWVMLSATLLFFASRQVLANLLEQRPQAFIQGTPNPFDASQDDRIYVLLSVPPGNGLEVTSPDWVFQSFVDG